jgi:hypothetical protein
VRSRFAKLTEHAAFTEPVSHTSGKQCSTESGFYPKGKATANPLKDIDIEVSINFRKNGIRHDRLKFPFDTLHKWSLLSTSQTWPAAAFMEQSFHQVQRLAKLEWQHNIRSKEIPSFLYEIGKNRVEIFLFSIVQPF